MRATLPSVLCLAALVHASMIQASLAASPACDPSDETQAGMNACADAEYRREDARLNEQYGKIAARLADDAEGKARLKAAERAWLAFRDAECAFSTAAVSDGSAYPMLLSQCRAELTRTRADQLGTYLSCEEGDMSCPVPPSP